MTFLQEIDMGRGGVDAWYCRWCAGATLLVISLSHAYIDISPDIDLEALQFINVGKRNILLYQR